LILVLSPVVVFSVINPRILDLKITGIEKLRPEDEAVLTGTWESSQANAAELCTQQGGTPTTVSGGTIRCTAKAGASCPTYPEGSTKISPDQEACCTKQDKCTLQKDPRSQTFCACGTSATPTAPKTNYILSFYAFSRDAAGTKICYVRGGHLVASDSSCQTELASLKKGVPAGTPTKGGTISSSDITIVKSCVATTDSSYDVSSIAVSTSLPSCAN
jgi:hypothetical protein